MSKYTALAILASFFSCLSCNKDDNHSSGKKQLDSIEYTTFGQKLFYQYNTDNQIIQEEELNSYRTTVNVDQSVLHLLSVNTNEDHIVADVEFYLNSDGNIESGAGNITYNVAAPYSNTYGFDYNSDGYMTRYSEAQSNGNTWTYNFYWTNGDLDRWEWLHNGTLYLTYYYEYDNSLEDKLQINNNQLILMTTNSWTGKSSKHLPTRSFQIAAPGTAITVDYRYTYTFDSDGYVTEIKLNDVLGTYNDVIKYLYK